MNNLGLQSALQEVLNLETEHIIELHPVVGQHSGPEKKDFEDAQLR